ncbi:TonB-dependent receptor [Pseudoxanthomonas sp.]|uniref:TonB-dependent receptor plug domain-containing protein n=1 Tax=Pseudoxanthomonas sp. TaxID=1871049 RepID=UPI00260F19EA|nr:TonB-dependent receptor [Pseudoxanthomonas sp.]WDS37009.1 MAG: TonB-dependent receptor [Pseudoxanthomonas sp.]
MKHSTVRNAAKTSPRILPLASLLGAMVAAWSSPAQESRSGSGPSPDGSNTAASTLDAVLVTGSRSSTRTVKNSSTPIDVVSAQDLAATGKGSLLEALQYALPSLSQNGGYQGDQESLIRGYRLRNLSPGYTLVLVNGKRRNTSAYASSGTFAGHAWTDLALIPVSAIDHVEVLRDGASAIYGSDAIAGVINVILKSQSRGGGVSVESGQSTAGDGARTTLRANLGLPWGQDGFLDIAAEVTNQEHAIRSLAYRDGYLSYPAVDGSGNLVKLGANNTLPAGTTANPAEATRNAQAQTIYSSPAYDLKSLSLNAGRSLSDALDFYATATVSDRTAEAIQNFRLPNTVFSNNAGALSVWPDGFAPVIQTKEQEYTGTTGIKGSFGAWSLDASVTGNRDTIRTYTRDSVNYSLTYPGSPTDFYDGKVDYQQYIGNFDARRAFEVGFLDSPLDFSAGLEYQYERYARSPGQWESYYGSGASAFIGFQPADSARATRNSKAVYVGASANVTRRWFLDLAGRYEDHSDFGDVSTGRISTRFDVSDSFGVRATVSNGFHAPSLAAQYYQVTSNSPTASYLTASVNSAAARALGAVPLQPEKANNYSVGFTYDPNQGFHAAVDFYQIDVRDQLGASSYVGYNAANPDAVTDYSGAVLTADQKAAIDALLANAGVTIPDGQAYFVKYFTNIGDTRTRGVELTLEASQDTRWGRFRYNYAINASRTEITKVAQVPQALQALPNLSLLTQSTEYSLRYGSPAYTQVAGIGWNRGALGLNLNFQYFGPLRQLSNGYKYQIDPRLLTSISGSYDVGGGWSVGLGVDNLFNEKTRFQPDQALTASSLAAWQEVYNTADRVSTVGAYWYGRISFAF